MIQLRVSRKRGIFFVVGALLVTSLFVSAWALRGHSVFADGTGSENDPYIIMGCAELQAIDNNLNASYALGTNVDCAGSETWNGGAGFSPIGFAGGGFSGNFDGRGHSITNLTINRPTDDNVGIFSFGQDSQRTIKNVRLDGITVTGQYNVGALIGYYYGSSIENIQITHADVEATSDQVGTLVGFIYRSSVQNVAVLNASSVTGVNRVGGVVGAMLQGSVGTSMADATVHGSAQLGGLVGRFEGNAITNSYATGDTEGFTFVGGLIGYAMSESNVNIYNNYSSGTATANGAPSAVGGLIGELDLNGVEAPNAVITNNFTQTAVTAAGSGEAGLIGALEQPSTPVILDYTSNVYDEYFTGQTACVGSEVTPECAAEADPGGTDFPFSTETNAPFTTWNFTDTWLIPDSTSLPILRMENRFNFAGGDGTQTYPFGVTTCGQLQQVSQNLAAYYEQLNDIDCSDTPNWDGGKGFNPIGDDSTPFTGSFDGGGFTISHLTIIRADDTLGDAGSAIDEHYVGLFGFANGALFHDIHLENAKIKGFYDVGGLVGRMDNGTMTDSSVNATTSNSDLTCGLGKDCVWARYGTYGGGLVGFMYGGGIDNSHTSGPVKGSGNVIGGLVGHMENSAQITNSYSNSHIDGGSYLGGAVGEAYDSSVIHKVHATGDVYATVNDETNKPGLIAGGLIGQATNTEISESYATGDVHADMAQAGGFAGVLFVSSVADSFATGDSDSIQQVGGFAGYIYESEVTRAYSSGDATATNSLVGGFVGQLEISTANVTKSFATGHVSGTTDQAGGFVGTGTSTAGRLQDVYFDATATGQPNCKTDSSHQAVSIDGSCTAVNINGTDDTYFTDINNAPFTINGGGYWNPSTWYFNGSDLPTLYTGVDPPVLISPAADPDTTSKAYKDIEFHVYLPSTGLSGSYKITLVSDDDASVKILSLNDMPTGHHFFTIDSDNPESNMRVSAVAPAGPIADGRYTVTFQYTSLDGSQVLSSTSHYVYVSRTQSMLCEAPSSTNTSVTTGCTKQPLNGFGATTWEARYRKASDSVYIHLPLSDPTADVQHTTISGLTPGTLYYVEYRFTNDEGTSQWGRVEVDTSGTAPVSGASEAAPSSQSTEGVSNAAITPDDIDEIAEAANGGTKTPTSDTTVDPVGTIKTLNEFAWWWWILVGMGGIILILIIRAAALASSKKA